MKNSDNDNRTKETGGKKSKKNRKKRDDSDEDIEKVLAELEMEYSGIKKDEPVDNNKEENVEIQEKKESKKKKEVKKDVDNDEPIEQEGKGFIFNNSLTTINYLFKMGEVSLIIKNINTF